ncbi:MAG: hypothetical protein Q4D04_10535, partial [Clostridia bacterium]|nr:hypothetical protein [Clostridia bacterium]
MVWPFPMRRPLSASCRAVGKQAGAGRGKEERRAASKSPSWLKAARSAKERWQGEALTERFLSRQQ